MSSRVLLPKFTKFRKITKEVPKWTDKNSLYYKLPEHYKRAQRSFLNNVPQPVHYKKADKLFEVDYETGTKYNFTIYYFSFSNVIFFITERYFKILL